MSRNLLGLRFLRPSYRIPVTIRPYSDWRSETISKWKSPEEIEEARKWVESFKVEDIPKKAYTLSYSASSGPGGQNVNKLATKATLHLNLTAHGHSFLPDFVVRKIRENSNRVNNNDEIVIQADESRKKTENSEEAVKRLYHIMVTSVQKDVPGVTSAEKHDRVKELQKKDAQLRRKLKTKQHEKKDGRRRKGGDD